MTEQQLKLKEASEAAAEKSMEQYKKDHPYPPFITDDLKKQVEAIYIEEFKTHFIEGVNWQRQQTGLELLEPVTDGLV